MTMGDLRAAVLAAWIAGGGVAAAPVLPDLPVVPVVPALSSVPGLPVLPAVPAGVPIVSWSASVGAQERTPRVPRPRPRPFAASAGGWLGIGFRELPDGGDGDRLLQIAAVFPGSPAEAAGIRPGDTLVRLAGTRADPGALRRALAQIRPGDQVELQVRREGRLLPLRVRAAERPSSPLAPPPPPTIRLRIDSISRAVVRSLDSIRAVVGASIPDGASLVKGLRMSEVDVGPPVPFSVFVAASDHTDELREQIEELTERAEALASRRAEMTEAARRPPDGSGGSDELALALERLRTEEVALRSAADALRRRLRAVADRELREVRIRRAAPLAPQIVGLRFLAGAEVSTLSPGLADYFGADEGVLVMRVPEGTPADEAGLAAGDVIVRVEGERVASLDELRRLLGDPDRRTLTVIRRSEEVRIRLGR